MFKLDLQRAAMPFAAASLFAAVLGFSGAVLAPNAAQADNSCVWAFDGECDDPTVPGALTSACSPGTDDADCGIGGGGGGGGGGLANPCPFTNDGDCDEPNGLGLCAWGTDTADCSNPNSNFGSGSGFAGGGGGGGGGGLANPCPFTNDGDCDEPNGLGLCAWGTDTADCSNPNSNFGSGSGFAGGGGGLANPCPFTNDGDCDEPNGLGLCAWGTDTADCSNPNSNFGSGSGFAGGTFTNPTRPAIPSTQEGRNIQTALNYFGFNAGVVDGQIGAGTRRAIEQFQASQGYPVNGRNFSPDQSGFLLGAYAWATAQGGAAQTGLGGIPLLAAYRTQLQGGGTATGGTLLPTLPQTPGPRPGAPGRSGGAVAGACPTPQNSDGFEVIYPGYTSQYFLDTDGSTGEWTVATDGTYAYDAFYHPLGLLLESWDVNEQRIEVPNTRETVTYVGTPQQPPAPAPGVTWSGTETATFGDGTSETFQTSVEVIAAQTEMIGNCSYSFLPIVVSRTVGSTGDSFLEFFAYVQDFGITVYVGYQEGAGDVIGDEPIDIRIRADDGFGPASGGGAATPAAVPAPAPAPAPQDNK